MGGAGRPGGPPAKCASIARLSGGKCDRRSRHRPPGDLHADSSSKGECEILPFLVFSGYPDLSATRKGLERHNVLNASTCGLRSLAARAQKFGNESHSGSFFGVAEFPPTHGLSKRPARACVAAAATGRGSSLESQRPRLAARRRARRWRTAAALRRCSSRR
jgi:hypothetical protein